MAQPALRIKKVPSVKIINKSNGGIPSLDSHKAQ
jgi:hypothetical protein